jgi:hypothetical protein
MILKLPLLYVLFGSSILAYPQHVRYRAHPGPKTDVAITASA